MAHPVQGGADPRQGRAQIVGGGIGDPLDVQHQLLDLLQGPVDRQGEQVELVAGPGERHARPEIAADHRAAGGLELGQPPQGASAQQDPGGEADHGDGAAAPEQRIEQDAPQLHQLGRVPAHQQDLPPGQDAGDDPDGPAVVIYQLAGGLVPGISGRQLRSVALDPLAVRAEQPVAVQPQVVIGDAEPDRGGQVLGSQGGQAAAFRPGDAVHPADQEVGGLSVDGA